MKVPSSQGSVGQSHLLGEIENASGQTRHSTSLEESVAPSGRVVGAYYSDAEHMAVSTNVNHLIQQNALGPLTIESATRTERSHMSKARVQPRPVKFSFQNRTHIVFGSGEIGSLSKHIPENAKVLLLYGGGSIKRNGIYDQVTAQLNNVSWVEFSGVESNPTTETLDEAVALVKRENVNFILAVGGGSVVDGSKYVAASACYDGSGWDIVTGKKTVDDAIPIGAIITLPATGSESNGTSVMTKNSTQDKLPFSSNRLLPMFAILDPDVIKSLPENQIKNGLADAFVHVCEQYLTVPTQAKIHEGYAETLLRTLVDLAETFPQRDNDEWRANLMHAANQALNGMIGAGAPQDWATHMVGHELTALYGVPHARSLTVIQPSLLRHEIEGKRAKLEQMGRQVFSLPDNQTLAEDTIDAIERLYQGMALPIRFNGYTGSKEEAIAIILSRLEQHSMTELGEHKAIGLPEIKAILESALV